MNAQFYPYLVWSLALCAACALAIAARPRLRAVAIASALLSAPHSLLAFVFVPAYWDPQQLVRIVAGPEDFLFSLANGGIVWILAGSYYVAPRRFWSRGFLARVSTTSTCYIIAWFLVCWATGWPVMWAGLAAGVGLWLALLARDPGALAISLRTGALFATAYTLLLALILYAWPEFIASWALEGLSGSLILGAPLQEVLWAFEFGAVWPLLVAYYFGARPARDRRRPPHVGKRRVRGARGRRSLTAPC